jgi:hypothetical protein
MPGQRLVEARQKLDQAQALFEVTGHHWPHSHRNCHVKCACKVGLEELPGNKGADREGDLRPFSLDKKVRMLTQPFFAQPTTTFSIRTPCRSFHNHATQASAED